MKKYFNVEDIIDFHKSNLSPKTMNTILNLIVSKYNYYSEYDKQYINIGSNEFFSISHNYKDYIDCLINYSYLERNNSYSDGSITSSYPKSFRLTKYFFDNAKIISIKFDKTDNKQGKIQNTLIEINSETNKKLEDDFYHLEVINTNINKKYDSNGNIKFKKYLNSTENIFRILNGNTFFNWKSGRLYTPFTYCNSEVRLNNFRFLFSDQPLTTIDIAHSFPMFLTKWLIDKGIDQNNNDFIEWVNLIKMGRDKNKSKFYEDIRIKLNKNRNSDGLELYNKENDIYTKIDKPFISYSKAKTMFQQWLNGKEKNNFINNTFKFCYNSIYEIVDRNEYKMYEEIVKLETDFIINNICTKLYLNIPGIKIITCHDQIYFENKYYEQANKIVKTELNKIFDILGEEYKETYFNDDILKYGGIEAANIKDDILIYQDQPKCIRREIIDIDEIYIDENEKKDINFNYINIDEQLKNVKL